MSIRAAQRLTRRLARPEPQDHLAKGQSKLWGMGAVEGILETARRNSPRLSTSADMKMELKVYSLRTIACDHCGRVGGEMICFVDRPSLTAFHIDCLIRPVEESGWIDPGNPQERKVREIIEQRSS